MFSDKMDLSYYIALEWYIDIKENVSSQAVRNDFGVCF